MKPKKRKLTGSPKKLYDIKNVSEAIQNILIVIALIFLSPLLLGGTILTLSAIVQIGLLAARITFVPITLTCGVISGVWMSLYLDDIILDEEGETREKRANFLWMFVSMQTLTVIGILIFYNSWFAPVTLADFIFLAGSIIISSAITWMGDDDTAGAAYTVTSWARVKLYWLFRNLDAVLSHFLDSE